MIRPVAQKPRFPDRSVVRQRRGEPVGQASATPDAILNDLRETHWIERDSDHDLRSFATAPELLLAPRAAVFSKAS